MSMKTFAPQLSVFFRFELLRVLGAAAFGGSEVGEVLQAAEQIKQDDPETWYRVWTEASQRIEATAEECEANGDVEGALTAFLRATNYRRASEFMLHIRRDDSRMIECLHRASSNFKRACSLMDSPVVEVEIPYDGTTLPGYLFLPTARNAISGPTPLMLVTGGYDSIQEELYFGMAAGARTRGYACLVFEGPGQGVVVRRTQEQGQRHLRPDWEVVIGAVLDHVFDLRERDDKRISSLDLSKIALVGASMGGYFALRGATDKRVSAAVSLDGFYDLGEYITSTIPALFRPETCGDAIFNWILNRLQWLQFQTRWEFQHGMLAMGKDTPAELYHHILQYRLQKDDGTNILDSINCPVLVSGSLDSLYWKPHESAMRIMDGMSQLKEGGKNGKHLWLPEGWGQGSLQAKVGAWSHMQIKMFAWLDYVFEVERSSLHT